jgi:8-oxo-dGTP diphosphatase
VTNNPTWLPVVALALLDPAGRVLLQQRPLGKHHAELWEFPGGKVESDEKPRDSLVREIAEELAITLDPGQLRSGYFAEETGERSIVMLLYTSHQKGVLPVGQDGQQWGWFTLTEASDLPLAPMDRELLGQIAGVAQ